MSLSCDAAERSTLHRLHGVRLSSTHLLWRGAALPPHHVFLFWNNQEGCMWITCRCFMQRNRPRVELHKIPKYNSSCRTKYETTPFYYNYLSNLCCSYCSFPNRLKAICSNSTICWHVPILSWCV